MPSPAEMRFRFTIPDECKEFALQIYLRPLEDSDLDYLYRWENDPAVWQYGDCGAEVSHSTDMSPVRFSKEELRQFIENQQQGFHANEQLRLVICRHEGADESVSTTRGGRVGFIDLFDFDPVGLTAGVGILICDPANRRRGYGREALALALDHARRELGLKEINCTIAPDNPASKALFTAAGFRAKKTLDFRQE